PDLINTKLVNRRDGVFDEIVGLAGPEVVEDDIPEHRMHRFAMQDRIGQDNRVVVLGDEQERGPRKRAIVRKVLYVRWLRGSAGNQERGYAICAHPAANLTQTLGILCCWNA